MEHYGAGRENKKNVTAFVKYLCALFLFGLNGIVPKIVNSLTRFPQNSNLIVSFSKIVKS